MSNKSIKQLRDLSVEELGSKERELRASLFQARMQKATGQLENTSSVWKMRKDLARVKMLQTQTSKGKTA